jgi:hypothetical protein
MKMSSKKASRAATNPARKSQRGNITSHFIHNHNTVADWLPEAWTVGTTDVWCPSCGRQITFAPQFLGLLACECHR